MPGESRVTEEAALRAVELCRSLGMDVKHAETNGDTALHAVAFYGWVQMGQWLIDHEYQSLAQAQGSMSLERSPNPEAFERGNYMRILQSWHPKTPA